MEEKAEKKQRFCGNCSSHSTYNYPDQVFCTRRFFEKKNPITQTLWCCEEWSLNVQECCCVEEAMKKQK